MGKKIWNVSRHLFDDGLMSDFLFYFLNHRCTMLCDFGACILTIFIFKFVGDLDLFNQNSPDPVTVLMNWVLEK